jgi:UDP-N-acetylglucosamine 2-epimerase
MVVGERTLAARAGLGKDGFALVEPPDGRSTSVDEVEEIAAALRAFDDVLGGGEVDGLVLAGPSNEALAAVLVATKRRIPVVAMKADGADPDPQGPTQVNRLLIEHLADATLTDDATALGAWLRESQPPTHPGSEH